MLSSSRIKTSLQKDLVLLFMFLAWNIQVYHGAAPFNGPSHILARPVRHIEDMLHTLTSIDAIKCVDNLAGLEPQRVPAAAGVRSSSSAA